MSAWALVLLASIARCADSVTPRFDATGDASDGAATDAPGDIPPRTDTVADLPTASDAAMCPPATTPLDDCGSDTDCALVARGCFCGQQPVVGVNRRYESALAQCELAAARNCALGCAVMPGQQAQDGRTTDDGGTIAVRCNTLPIRPVCQSYVR